MVRRQQPAEQGTKQLVMELQNKGQRSGRELAITVLGLNEVQERGCSSDEYDSSVKWKPKKGLSALILTKLVLSSFLAFRAQYPAYLIVWLHASSKHALQLVLVEPMRSQVSTLHISVCVFVFHKRGKIPINCCRQACAWGSAGNGEINSQAAPRFDNGVQPGTTSWA